MITTSGCCGKRTRQARGRWASAGLPGGELQIRESQTHRSRPGCISSTISGTSGGSRARASTRHQLSPAAATVRAGCASAATWEAARASRGLMTAIRLQRARELSICTAACPRKRAASRPYGYLLDMSGSQNRTGSTTWGPPWFGQSACSLPCVCKQRIRTQADDPLVRSRWSFRTELPWNR